MLYKRSRERLQLAMEGIDNEGGSTCGTDVCIGVRGTWLVDARGLHACPGGVEQGRPCLRGGAMMVLAMILAAAIDIRLRSPHVRKVQ
ncbi:hypothetical protein [Alicyclobacillus sacchari]|uniref:hypothetical protein n=1 Tax=Alicyclobacillus sacchari TaxID=392010 RepID=UPI0024E045F3|nr:hypothetical protein [Alicyclobacillus sacchari]